MAQDLRYAVRTLGRTPAYALVIMAVLSLGIGANVSVFSVFKALALTPILSEGGEGEDGKFAAESPGRIRGLPSTSVSANAGYPLSANAF